MTRTPTAVAVNRVRPGAADEFERWLTEVGRPAATAAGIEPDGVQVLRDVDDDVFVFLFFGAAIEHFDLEPMLEHHFGAERAAQEMAHLIGLMRAGQEAWTVRSIPF